MMRLPYNVPINDALDVLGLNNRPVIEALNILLDFSIHDGLPIYFDTNILGEEFDVSDVLGEEPDVDYFSENVPTERNKLIWIKGAKCIGRLSFYIEYDGIASVSLSSFTYNGKPFYAINPAGGNRDYIYLNCNQFYIHRDDLAKFKGVVVSTETPIGSEGRSPPVSHTWKEVFTNSPQRYSQIFECFKQAVTAYIERNGQIPAREQVWDELMRIYGNEENKKNKKSISGISGTAMDRENFRSNYDRYAAKIGQEQDK